MTYEVFNNEQYREGYIMLKISNIEHLCAKKTEKERGN